MDWRWSDLTFKLYIDTYYLRLELLVYLIRIPYRASWTYREAQLLRDRARGPGGHRAQLFAIALRPARLSAFLRPTVNRNSPEIHLLPVLESFCAHKDQTGHVCSLRQRGGLAAGAQSDGGPAVLCWACGLPSPLPSAHALCLRCLCLTARVLCPRTQADTCGGAADQASSSS